MTNWRMAGIAALALLAVAWVAPASTGRGTAAPRQASPGDLTKPIDQYTGDEFFAFVNELGLGQGAERARRCRGNPACTGAQRTNVRVDGIAGVDSLSAGNVPQFGSVAAKAVVRGNDADAMYGMLPTGASGRYSYYLIVMPGGATWRLEELNIQGDTRSHRMLITGRFTQCSHPYVRGARADFKTCADASASAQGVGIFRRASFVALPQGGGEPPLWIGCASGCCTADG